MTYTGRIADKELVDRLQAAGAVVIEGPKACGKTETARQVAKSEVLLDIDTNARAAAGISPALVLAGETPRLIDEWQVEPEIWSHVRRAVDERGQPGQFVLTGSASPADELTRHSGAGRISRLRLRPMSSFETGASDGVISLAAQLAGERTEAAGSKLGLEQLSEEISRGGWPGFRRLPLQRALQSVRDYIDEIRRVDVRQVGRSRHDPERVARLLSSLGRNIATSAAAKTLAADAGGADGSLDEHTVADYLAALRRLFIVEDQPAWEPHLRSRYVLRKSAKRHFVDPSLAVAALGANPKSLLKDLNFLRLLFESLAVRDLRIYSQPLRGRVAHYRDNSGLEVDAIVETDDSWGAFEVKLGGERGIDLGAATLLRFARQVDTAKVGTPAVLAVIVATGYGYVRADGVQVIPVGALGP